MSAALKRRFNFETVHPISDIAQEMELVQRQANRNLERSKVPVKLDEDLTELRQGKGMDGLSTVMSTAEAVGTAYAAGVHAYYYADGQIEPAHLVTHLVGTVLKDNEEDLRKVRHYFDHVVKKRKTSHWQ